VTITGTGFSDSMKMTATGLAFSSFNVISPTRVEATLASTGEITGTRFQIENLYSNTIDYFASPPSAVTSSDQYTIGAGAHAVLPFTEQQGTLLSFTRPVMAILQNPTVSPADVRVREAVSVGPVSSRHFTLAPGAIMTVAGPFAVTQYFIDSDTPLRMRQYLSAIGGVYIQPPAPASSDVPPVSLTASPNDFTVNYQTGGATPDPRMIRLYSYTGRFPGATLQVTGAPWLSVSQPDSSGTFSASFDPSGLAPGTYQGTITATPTVSSALSEFPVKAATVKVTLIVSAQPTLIIQPTQVEPPANTTYYTPTSLAVKTNGTSAAFIATVKTNDGANWLSIDRTSGTTPATINVQANSTGLAGGYYSGKISVAGPVNTVETSVDLVIYPIPKPKMTITPAYSETREEGVGPPRLAIPLTVSNKSGLVTVQTSTDDGAKWLTATVQDQNTSAVVLTNIDPTALPAGTYHGTVTATAAGESASSRITIVILPKPRTLVRLSPSSFHFVTSVGVESPPQTLTIDSDGPAILNFSSPDSIRIKDDGGSPFIAPRTLTIAGFSTIPGTFTGNLTISNSFGSTSVPVTVDVAGSATTPPVLSSVVNAASHRPNALAPGEMITLRGIGIGPPPTGLQLDSPGRISTNAATDTRVEINGRPAPVLYASPNQWNVIVPYEVADRSSATVRVLTYGAPSRVWTLPVAPAAPAISRSVRPASVRGQF